jgi:fucose permease
MGAVLVAALLPDLAHAQHLDDRQSGLLLGSQFLGSFVGGITVLMPPQRSLRRGPVYSVAALLSVTAALAQGAPPWMLDALLLVFGYGLGQMITAANLMAGQEKPETRAAHLSLVNLLWSLGATASPLIVSATAQRLPLPVYPGSFSLLFIVVAIMAQRAEWPQSPVPDLVRQGREGASEEDIDRNAPLFAAFAVLFFFYGGAEASLSGWLSSYGQRFGGATAATMPLLTAGFWAGINLGRAAAAVVLRHVPEMRAVRLALCVFLAAAYLLLQVHAASAMALLAALLGLCLAPVFPAALSQAGRTGISERRLAGIMAMCGLGSAALPWLVGAVSYGEGSLRIGLTLPLACVAAMLGLLFFSPLAQQVSAKKGSAVSASVSQPQ